METLLTNGVQSVNSYLIIQVKEESNQAVVYYYNGEDSAQGNRKVLHELLKSEVSGLTKSTIIKDVDLSESGLECLELKLEDTVSCRAYR